MTKKEQILLHRSDKKTYREIQLLTGCSKSTISYYCGEGQKEKNKERLKNRRKTNSVHQKTHNFQARFFKLKVTDFQKDKKLPFERFTWQEVLKKIGENPVCYLTGTPIDLSDKKSYHFDHIVPTARGGTNSISNLGILNRDVNFAKRDLMVDEFIALCKRVLEHNGFSVTKTE